jgi:hypothetical protein
MSKKGLFLAHTSVRNEVFVFLVHFPEVPNWLKFPNKTWFFRYRPIFNFSWGVPNGAKSLFL